LPANDSSPSVSGNFTCLLSTTVHQWFASFARSCHHSHDMRLIRTSANGSSQLPPIRPAPLKQTWVHFGRADLISDTGRPAPDHWMSPGQPCCRQSGLNRRPLLDGRARPHEVALDPASAPLLTYSR